MTRRHLTILTVLPLVLVLTAADAWAQGTPMPSPYQTVLDANGLPVSGAKIYTYRAGTTTAASTYADAGLVAVNANPIVADSAGRYVAFLPVGLTFKFVITTSAGVTIRTVDGIMAVPQNSFNLDVAGVAGETLLLGEVVYLSNGQAAAGEGGPRTLGAWYKAFSGYNASFSSLPIIGMAIANISVGGTGTIRIAGVAPTNSAVEVGSTYYLSGTPGAITGSAVYSYARTVGVAASSTTMLLSNWPGEAAYTSVPIGMVFLYASATSGASPGHLLCDGSAISRTTYAALFAVIGTTFNTGGEAGTEFRVPNITPSGPFAGLKAVIKY